MRHVVESNNKKRFELKQDGIWFIRAVQGHTIQDVKDDDLLTPITKHTIFDFKEVVHGTY